MNRFVKPLHGAFVGFILFAGIALLGTHLYYKFMPGDWFINYYSVKVSDGTVGTDLQVDLCRTVRYEKADVKATRTFVLKQEGDRFQPVGEYDFNPSVEKSGAECVSSRITPDKQPQVAGTYKFYTEAEFYVEGNRKTISYASPEYKITARVQSLQQQIDALNAQINVLKQQQR